MPSVRAVPALFFVSVTGRNRTVRCDEKGRRDTDLLMHNISKGAHLDLQYVALQLVPEKITMAAINNGRGFDANPAVRVFCGFGIGLASELG